MPNTTPNYGLLQPLVNNATDQDLWGGYLNTTIGDVDSLMSTAMNFTPSVQTSTIAVTAPTSGSITTGSSKTLYLCNATGGAFAANLPAVATASGMVVAFKKTDSSANAITITGHSSDNIDGSNTFALSAQYSYVILVCDGTQWDIIAQTAPSFIVPQFRQWSQFAAGSYTFTTPSNITTSTVFKITLTGGGGGSGGVQNGASPGASAATTGILYATGLSANTGYAVVVGAAGVAGTNVPGNGQTGGTTSITIGATTSTAPGGPGSNSASNTGQVSAPSLSSAATNCTISIIGGGGQTGAFQGNANFGGIGGASYWGGGGQSPSNGGAANPGGACGSGASGADNNGNATGAAGKDGGILIEYVA